jgi:DNA-directed RNA polymerase subunit RPC12/RpoP
MIIKDDANSISYKCSDCKREIEKSSIECPFCGSKNKLVSVVVKEKFKIEDHIKGHVKSKEKTKKQPGKKKKPYFEHIFGDYFHFDSKKWNWLNRIIDRKNDFYKEEFKNKKTDKIVHSCEEPLSEHTGHGSAKKGSQ